ncbi:MAG TPA: trehalase family glycosidase [Tepidisphaeraceae bacterium]|jgi:hypothetical protein|nr:trehalase family glycosidase [Tepidisphaeraceae bacterium]
MPFLQADQFKHHVDSFNAMDEETIVNLIPNTQSWQWMTQNIPLFTCPDKTIEKIYYFRWWTYRKHIVQTPAGLVVTEFLPPVSHGGPFNTISCAAGHHIAEGRWLRDQKFLDDYTRFWFRGDNGKPLRTFHHYSSWIASAMYDRYLVTGDHAQLIDLFDDLTTDYTTWEAERLRPDGLFWQFDVRDGMESSISGSRTFKNARPTINSYMYGNARAIAEIATIAGKEKIAPTYRSKADALKALVQKTLWDSDAHFFKAQIREDGLSDAREEIGFIPWAFNLPDAGYEDAWIQLIDPHGFWAPFGITTAEQRHPRFRAHRVGNSEWDGAVWPFATSQTLSALANLIRQYKQSFVTREHYLEAIQAYAHSQLENGKPYIGDYLDGATGEWIKGDNPRSRFYNHSTFNDLIINGLVGIVPRPDATIEIDSLLPDRAWDWFCLQGVPYHGQQLTIIWDQTGKKFNVEPGLNIFVEDRKIAHSPNLSRLIAKLT